MPMVEDLAVFFNAAEFASDATLKGVAVVGILDQPYAQSLDGMASSDPTFMLPSASAAGAAQGDTLVVAGVTYRVRSVQSDGTGPTGATTLLLEQRS